MKILPISNLFINKNTNKTPIYNSNIVNKNVSFDGFQKQVKIQNIEHYESLIKKINSSIDASPINIEIPNNIKIPNLSNSIKKIKSEFQHYSNYLPYEQTYDTFFDKAKKGATRFVKYNDEGEISSFKKIDKNGNEISFLSFVDNKPYHYHNEHEKYIMNNDNVILYIKRDNNLEFIYEVQSKNNESIGSISSINEFDNINNKKRKLDFLFGKPYKTTFFIDNKPCKIIKHDNLFNSAPDRVTYIDEDGTEFVPKFYFWGLPRYEGIDIISPIKTSLTPNNYK